MQLLRLWVAPPAVVLAMFFTVSLFLWTAPLRAEPALGQAQAGTASIGPPKEAKAVFMAEPPASPSAPDFIDLADDWTLIGWPGPPMTIETALAPILNELVGPGSLVAEVVAPITTLQALRVHFIDVGQGDAILLDFGTTEILIDGGDWSPGVTGYLSGLVDGPVEVMVATHPHADHIGGLITVLATLQVEEVWLNGDSVDTQTYRDFMAAVNSEGAVVRTVRRGDKLCVEFLCFVLHPVEPLGPHVNNNSIVLHLQYGQVDFLFTGDAEQEAEASMLAEGLIPDVEILKVGHHGSKTSSSQAFLDAARPEVAVYMAGQGNPYGHPHQETLARLAQVGARIYGTDNYGTIVITTDGSTYSVQTEREGPTPTIYRIFVPIVEKRYERP